MCFPGCWLVSGLSFFQFWYLPKTGFIELCKEVCLQFTRYEIARFILQACRAAVETSSWLIVITEREVLSGSWRATALYSVVLATLWHKPVQEIQRSPSFTHAHAQKMASYTSILFMCHWDRFFCPDLFSAELPKAPDSQVSFLFSRRSALCRTRQMETASTLQQSTS